MLRGAGPPSAIALWPAFQQAQLRSDVGGPAWLLMSEAAIVISSDANGCRPGKLSRRNDYGAAGRSSFGA
jgi:hypothetical protein